MTIALGNTNSIDIIDDQWPLKGREVIDVGCGDMTFSRTLVDRGATVLAVDPDAVQAAKNRAAVPVEGLTFQEGVAESLPVESASLDGVFFSFSLHHVPASVYPGTFAEIRRVLKPDGILCVIEPADGPLNTVMKNFHDEDAERAAAQDVLCDLAIPMFESHQEFTYHSIIEFDDFEDFARRYGSRSFNPHYTDADVRKERTRTDFERLGAPEYRFESPKRMMLLRNLRG